MSDWSFYDRGFSLFPLHARSKTPAIQKWEPFQECRASPDQIAAWAKHPSNTGVATGAVSGVIVLDADSLIARIEAESRGIPDTLTIATPRGTHFYFQHPGWVVKNRAGRSWTVELDGVGVDGWDLRADGGYVVGPGSYYVPTATELAKGKVEGAYLVERDVAPAPAPDWLLALIFPKAHKPNVPAKVAEETTEYGRSALNSELGKLTSTPSGAVNVQINLSAFAIGQLVTGGEIRSDEAWGALWEALHAMGLDEDDKGFETLERGWMAGMEAPRGVEHHEAVTTEQALGVRHAAGAPAAPPPPSEAAAVLGNTVKARGVTIWTHEMEAFFTGCYFVERQEAVYIRGRGLQKATNFDTTFGGFEFPMDIQGKKKTNSAWAAFRMSPGWACPIVHDVAFRPDKKPGEVIDNEGRRFINSYEPIPTKRIQGDPSRFLGLLRKMFPVDRDYQILTAYMCAVAQNPGRKFQWWPVIQGVKGNGKSLVLNTLQFAVGKRYTHYVDPDVLGKTANQFNSWIQGNLLIGVEEIFVNDQRHILETFKPIVTNVRTRIEAKGKDATSGDNFCNGMMLTNYRNGVPISDDERRYAIFFSAQQDVEDLERDGMDGAYFADLHDYMNGRGPYAHLGEDYGFAVANEWLRTAVPNAEFNPAGQCQRAPSTSSTLAAIQESLGSLEQEVQEAIESEQVGFRAGVVTSHALRNLFDRCRKRIAPRAYKGIMKALGYHSHPMLAGNKGRFTNPFGDTTKPVVYYAPGSPFFSIDDMAELKAATEAAIASGILPGDNVVNFRTPLPVSR